jgi:hypothetical protein
LVAVVQAVDKQYRVTFAVTQAVKDSLLKQIEAGIDVVIPLRKEKIHICSHRADYTFLESLSRYLSISYQYYCICRVSDGVKSVTQDLAQPGIRPGVRYISEVDISPDVEKWRRVSHMMSKTLESLSLSQETWMVGVEEEVSPSGWII